MATQYNTPLTSTQVNVTSIASTVTQVNAALLALIQVATTVPSSIRLSILETFTPVATLNYCYTIYYSKSESI